MLTEHFIPIYQKEKNISKTKDTEIKQHNKIYLKSLFEGKNNYAISHPSVFQRKCYSRKSYKDIFLKKYFIEEMRSSICQNKHCSSEKIFCKILNEYHINPSRDINNTSVFNIGHLTHGTPTERDIRKQTFLFTQMYDLDNQKKAQSIVLNKELINANKLNGPIDKLKTSNINYISFQQKSKIINIRKNIIKNFSTIEKNVLNIVNLFGFINELNYKIKRYQKETFR